MQHNKAAVWLYIMRSIRGLSQRQLASKVRITHTAISQAESGYASAETWAKLAIYFRFTSDAVLWLAGVIELVKPPKQEIISRIENILSEMEPETREKAEKLIKQITDDP
jgi:transcriptional regulator with XRE-family HTH domain